jgi:biopolymer transport protein ExbB
VYLIPELVTRSKRYTSYRVHLSQLSNIPSLFFNPITFSPMQITLPISFLMGQSPMELFVHGGIIMWPILLVSFVAVTAVVERILFMVTESGRRQPALVEQMLAKVEDGDSDGAVAIGNKSKDYVARVLVYALTHREHSLTNAFTRAANQELNRFQRGIAVLDTCITISPLLGLLGTVMGMMNTFGALGDGDIAANAGKITGGVGEALIATAVGLAIAITGLLPYNVLNARVEEARHNITDAANALELNLKKEAHGRA